MSSLPDLSIIITENVKVSPIFFPESPSLSAAVREADESIINVLTNGMTMTKIPNKSTSRPKDRFIKVELEPLHISFQSKNGTKVYFDSIKEIRLGQNTKAFEYHGKVPEYQDSAFSIIYIDKGKYKILNLGKYIMVYDKVAPSQEAFVKWVYGLTMLIVQSLNDDPAQVHLTMSGFLKKMWLTVDVKNTGYLCFDDLTLLMRKLNINLSRSEVKSTFKNAHMTTLDLISFDNFERYYRNLAFRPEISELFNRIAISNSSGITYDEFRGFVKFTQNVQWSEDRIQEVFVKYSPDKEVTLMDMNHFTAFLLSANNSIFKKEHSNVYQNMNLPLSSYYINSSHNTYLLGDQITGESSVEGYIRALQQGCRCIEYCWDGPNGMPVVYHGHTLTNKISFKEVIEAIAKYAFSASEYPLILSLEVHCSFEQQNIMASLFSTVFSDSLIISRRNESETVLPSPESLKGKIILKGKVVSNPSSSDSENVVDDIQFENSNRAQNQENNQIKSKRKVYDSKLSQLIVYCRKIHFSGFPVTDHKFYHMFSFSEKRSNSLIYKSLNEYMEYNRNYLTRVYPSGIRITSSNFDPIPHWLAGCQLVAQNFQTFDKPLQINYALFSGNGHCGYILKPLNLMHATLSTPKILRLKIISAQQLPKPKDSTSSSIVDPSIDVEIIGRSNDCAKFRTRSIYNNGFNPTWMEEFEFKISELDLTFLRFTVLDLIQPICSYTIHLPNLQQGYRHIPLYNWKGNLARFSTLFVYISLV